MERLTKKVIKNNRDALFNFAFAKDQEVYLRNDNSLEDIRLVEYISQLAKEKGCECSPEDILNGDACWECDCEVDVLNMVAIQAAELRGRLMAIEDILGEEYDLDQLRKVMEAEGVKLQDIVERYKGFWSAICDADGIPQVNWGRASQLCRADKEGLAVVLPCKVGDTVYIPNITNCSRKVVPARVQGISITVSGRVLLRFGGFPFESAWGDECGKDWFLTSEEAEEAMKGGGAE